ncbi:hypothetical protein [Desulfitobacterium chlororespirans]|uniref:Uncharacterized protein n=1 Tax=Desulfitobacterium chlororespirans DSM 11544 TaxID=1121395 RepID=A0A1M7T5N7_9FIRM|nr:hypothetical protein [Desulfitobacterium chlororespirans]SHN66051.1 hypothetical protein SAMN02745215_01610 [Desulfitobacterium chlororespirans DSM 11544]
MPKFAQILDNKVYWIFEADMQPEFAPYIVIKDIADLVPQPQEGWLYDEATDTFSPPPEPGPEGLQPTLEEQIYAENLYQTALLEMQFLGGA